MKKKLCLFALLLGLVWACRQKTEPTHGRDQENNSVGAADRMVEAEALARIHCSSCHLYPEPNLLDRESWQTYMLPRMGQFMGIYAHDSLRESLIEKGPGGEKVRAANIYPRQPLLGKADWEAIQEFYLSQAPESLPPAAPKSIDTALRQFVPVEAKIRLSPPSATMVRFAEDGRFFIGDANQQSLFYFDGDQNLIKAAKTREGAVWMEQWGGSLWITVMGSFSPTDAPKGFIMELPWDEQAPPRIRIDGLQRPVHTAYGDLNGDGLTDAVVCEFGKWTGGLRLFTVQPDGSFRGQYLSKQPGAIKAYLRDWNQDGLMDVVALFGQGDEGIQVFYQKGDGSFRAERLLRFSPSNGSSYFALADWNGDGREDIIYTAGDNADFKPVLKPYHGVYIFENRGKAGFEQVFFYQLNGAYAALPRDFDGDGDLDLAAISFFPDYQNSPEESFVYLENREGEFFAQSFSDPTRGRWIVMDAGDYDGDGDEDLLLGSLAFEVVPPQGLVERWVADGLPYLILENQQRYGPSLFRRTEDFPKKGIKWSGFLADYSYFQAVKVLAETLNCLRVDGIVSVYSIFPPALLERRAA